VEIADGRPRVGDVFRARVTRVVPALQSAFVALGDERDALLHIDDLEATGGTAVEPRGSSGPAAGRIEERCRPDDEILVQVVRAPTANKGARVTSRIGLGGHLLVFLPEASRLLVSRRITDAVARDRLSLRLAELAVPREGWLARTSAASADATALQAEAEQLRHDWQVCLRSAGGGTPNCLLPEVDLLTRRLRVLAGESLRRVLVDNEDDLMRAGETLARWNPSWRERVSLMTGDVTPFEAYGLERVFDQSLAERVELRSGGYIVIEPTEALISIDVNSGSAMKRGDPMSAAHAVNLEAVDEIADQLRLRQLGGIVVIDFIDMPTLEQRRQLLAALQAALVSDPARTHIVGLSELGLVELTRQRSGAGPGEVLTTRCGACSGRGRMRHPVASAAAALLEQRRRGPAPRGLQWVLRTGAEIAAELRRIDPASLPATLIEVDASMPAGEFELRPAVTRPFDA
jgi:ribonuclease G